MACIFMYIHKCVCTNLLYVFYFQIDYSPLDSKGLFFTVDSPMRHSGGHEASAP
jgi:hypothetical protein